VRAKTTVTGCHRMSRRAPLRLDCSLQVPLQTNNQQQPSTPNTPEILDTLVNIAAQVSGESGSRVRQVYLRKEQRVDPPLGRVCEGRSNNELIHLHLHNTDHRGPSGGARLNCRIRQKMKNDDEDDANATKLLLKNAE